MCGIAGIMTRTGTAPDLALIERFKRDLRHRGPDGDGFFGREHEFFRFAQLVRERHHVELLD